MYNQFKTIALITIASISLFSCSKDNNNIENAKETAELAKKETKQKEVTNTKETISIEFDSRFGKNNFELNKDFSYKDKIYNIKMLRYWVSNISLIKEDGTTVNIPKSYYLIEENIAFESPNSAEGSIYPANKREKVNINLIPSGKYKAIKFSVGVDSKYNNNLSLQAGELSHGNGMVNLSWMWLSSYIFTKVEGKVTSKTETKDFIADTGLNDNYRTINIKKTFEVMPNKKNTVGINLQVEKLFENIDVFTTNKISANTTEEMKNLSDNYSNAFSAK